MNNKSTKRGGMYWVAGRPYPSVTSILTVLAKPALQYWFGREVYRAMVADPTLSEQAALAAPYKINDSAKLRGSAVHDIVEAWENTGQVIGQDGLFQGYAQAFAKWVKDLKVTIKQHEQTVFSKKHRYAGTLDLLVVLNGDSLPTLIDVKTGKDLYPEVHLQMSAYKQGLEEEGTQVAGTAALLLSEDGTYKFELGKNKLKEFLACKYIWEGLNQELLKKLNVEVQEGMFDD